MTTHTVFAKFALILVQLWQGEYHLEPFKTLASIASFLNVYKLGHLCTKINILIHKTIYSTLAILA